jgi:hypothetical protein
VIRHGGMGVGSMLRVEIAPRLGQPVFEHAGLAFDARARHDSRRFKILKRFDRSAGDIRGTPRRSSLKRVEPARSSRRRTRVHLEQRISAAIARGQNCL